MTITANIQDIIGRRVTTRNRCKKIAMLREVINTSRYEIVSFPGGGNKVTLRARFHTNRDKRGRFARTK